MRFILSLLFLGIVFAVWLFDIFAGLNERPQDTVSAVLFDWSRDFPILPLAVGVLLGHLFWPQRLPMP